MAVNNLVSYESRNKPTERCLFSGRAYPYFVKATDDPPSTLCDVLLNKALWPLFPDGAHLRPLQAARLHRVAHGLHAVIHVLNRSLHQRGVASDYEGEPDLSIGGEEESRLWAAMLELSADLVTLTDDLHASATQREDC